MEENSERELECQPIIGWSYNSVDAQWNGVLQQSSNKGWSVCAAQTKISQKWWLPQDDWEEAQQASQCAIWYWLEAGGGQALLPFKVTAVGAICWQYSETEWFGTDIPTGVHKPFEQPFYLCQSLIFEEIDVEEGNIQTQNLLIIFE